MRKSAAHARARQRRRARACVRARACGGSVARQCGEVFKNIHQPTNQHKGRRHLSSTTNNNNNHNQTMFKARCPTEQQQSFHAAKKCRKILLKASSKRTFHQTPQLVFSRRKQQVCGGGGGRWQTPNQTRYTLGTTNRASNPARAAREQLFIDRQWWWGKGVVGRMRKKYGNSTTIQHAADEACRGQRISPVPVPSSPLNKEDKVKVVGTVTGVVGR